MSDCQHNPGRELETGDVQNQGHQLGERSDEETLYKLVDCLYGGDGEVDIETIDRYLEELDQAEVAPDEFDVEKGLQQFHQRFDYPLEEVKPARKRRPLARIAIIAAAMCIFVVTAQASGWDIIGAIARWTSEQFAFVTAGEVRGDRQEGAAYASLQEALEDYSVVEKLSPTKFPNGTHLFDILVEDETENLLFSAAYTLANEKFFVSFRKISETPHSEVEINDPNVEIYLAGGIEHHIVTDVKQLKVTWCNRNWECYITGNLSRDDLVVMIDSIYE